MNQSKRITARLRALRGWSRPWTVASLLALTTLLFGSLLAQEVSTRPGTDRGDESTMDSEFRAEADPGPSPESLVRLLEQQPELLLAAKQAAANRLSIDPSTITDQATYDEIRHNPSLRAQLTAELNKRGYDVSFGSGSVAKLSRAWGRAWCSRR